MIDFGFYYNIFNTLTFNALFNFIIGNRGGGKSFSFKYLAIHDFLKTGSQFIYLRRYQNELKKVKTWFTDIAEFFPETKFEVKGKTFLINGSIAGYSMPLSTSKIEKSTAFPLVNKIGFDEFIIDKGVYHYLPNEIDYFLEFYETIARTREVKVFFMANAITQTNPYFLYFNIELPYNKEIQTFFNDGSGRFSKKRNKEKPDLLIQLVNDPRYIDMKQKTRFGQLIKGTDYSGYAIENNFLRDSKEFIQKKTESAKHKFIIEYKAQIIGVWIDYIAGLYFVSQDIDPSNEIRYVFTTQDHKINTLLISRISKSPLLKPFFDGFRDGYVRFESMDVKNVMYELMKQINMV